MNKNTVTAICLIVILAFLGMIMYFTVKGTECKCNNKITEVKVINSKIEPKNKCYDECINKENLKTTKCFKQCYLDFLQLNLSGENLTGANLTKYTLSFANLTNTNLLNCKITDTEQNREAVNKSSAKNINSIVWVKEDDE